jgi:hypothetical protein
VTFNDLPNCPAANDTLRNSNSQYTPESTLPALATRCTSASTSASNLDDPIAVESRRTTPQPKMASQDRGGDRMGRRVSRKRRDSRKEARGVSLDVPERFRDGDDAQEDVTAPKRNNTMSMNQSLFSMIARAGQQSQTDLGTMQEVDSGDSDDGGKQKATYRNLDGAARLSRLSSANDFQIPTGKTDEPTMEKGKHRRTLSENKLLRSLPKLKLSNRKDARPDSRRADQMSSSQFLPPKPSPDDLPTPPSDPPPKIKDKNKVVAGDDIQVEKGRNSGRKSRHGSSAGLAKSKVPVTLAQRIQQIFEFDEVEEVISEYACWLLQSILLQGYMYITQKHICFYAYIPKKHVSHLPTCPMNDITLLTIHISTTLVKQATSSSAADPSSTATGSSSAATSSHTLSTQPSSTSPETASTCNTLFPPKLSRAQRRVKRRLASP